MQFAADALAFLFLRVQDFAGKLAQFLLHRFGFVEQLPIMLLALAKRFLGPFARGDVASNRVKDILVRRGRRRPLRPAVGAVVAASTDFKRHQRGAGLKPLEFRLSRGAIVQVHPLTILHGEQLFRLVAENFLPRGIDAFQVTVEARHTQQVARKREEPVELLLDLFPQDHHAHLIRHG